MDGLLTMPGAAVTLRKMSGRSDSRRGSRGQSTVEYLLTTMALVTAFAGMYGFIQGQMKILFKTAAIKILTSYY